MKRYLYCVAHEREGNWEAICLDLDIAVQGRSLDDVTKSLNEAIGSYVEDAQQESEAVRHTLLSRTAPLSARLAWLWPFILNGLFGRSRDGDSTVGFQVACPA
jgi:predicted RNase H-like HicB family nuclease